MADHGQHGLANGRRQHNEDRGESGDGRGGSSGINSEQADAIGEALRHLAAVAEAQEKKKHSYTTMHTSSVLQAGSMFANLHLPEESAIATVFVENMSTATLTVYEGSGGSGRVIGIVPTMHGKRIALADHISSVSIVASAADPTGALVIVTLSTHRWSPQQSSLA